jgi:hypothetical protein
MVSIRFERFAGMAPLISSRLLPPNMAEQTYNASLRNGELRGVRQPIKIKDFSSMSAYGWAVRVPDPADPSAPVWIPFTSKYADFFPNPLTNDAFDRYVWIDNNAPGTAAFPVQNSFARIKAGQPTIQLGVPAPTNAPTVTVTGGSNINVTRSYVYTYVNIFDEEGAPSDPVTVTGHLNGTWTVTGFINPVNAATRGLNRIRLYRTISGSTGTQYFRVAQFAINTTTYTDSQSDADVALVGIILESTLWIEPLQMEGIALMPNGFFAGWKGRDLFFSEPYRPWAWPAEYTLSVDHPIIDCGVVGQTLIVLTSVSPVLVTGINPAAMSMAKLTQVEPCVSANSVASSPEGLYYASPNGLILISPQGLASVTQNIVGREAWQRDFLPFISDAVVYDSQYIAAGESGDGFIYGALGDQPYITHLINFSTIQSLWVDPYTGQVHMTMGNDVYEWDSLMSGYIPAQWLSKEFQYQRPINLGALMISFDDEVEVQSPFVEGFERITESGDIRISESSDIRILEVIQDPTSSIPVGGPWPEYVSIIGYNQINGRTINVDPLDGEYPPGNDYPTKVWPYWYGIVKENPELILTQNGKCEVTVYAGKDLVWQSVVEDGVVYRLPSGFKSERWQFEINTAVPVYNLQVAETSKELADV